MLKIIKAKSNIGLNKLSRIRTRNSIMLLYLIIFQKLLKIFTPIILINHNFKQKLENEKRIYLLERPCI